MTAHMIVSSVAFVSSLVDTALAGAGIPVLRVSARQAYSPVQIREQVHGLFHSRKRVKKTSLNVADRKVLGRYTTAL